MFPELADVGQKALNSSNGVASLVGEIEVAKAVVGFMKDAQDGWSERAAQAIKAMGAPCAPYARVIIKFVQKHCDGPSAPLVDILDGVAKQFACNAVLGETFWTAIVEAKFQTKETELPLLRCALVLANLTSSRFEDGIAKLLVKSDISKLVTKNMLEKSMAAETVLQDAMNIAKTVVKQRGLKNDEVLGSIGRVLVRVALQITAKEALGREGVKLSMDKIKKMFLSDMTQVAGGEVTYESWTRMTPAVEELEAKRRKTDSKETRSSTDGAPHVQLAEGPISFEQDQSAQWRALKAGFSTGNIVYETNVGSLPTGLFRIVEINDSIAVMRAVCDYENTDVTVTVETSSLYKSGRYSKENRRTSLRLLRRGQPNYRLTSAKQSHIMR